MFISIVLKRRQKTPKLTPMVRYRDYLTCFTTQTHRTSFTTELQQTIRTQRADTTYQPLFSVSRTENLRTSSPMMRLKHQQKSIKRGSLAGN